MSSIIINNSYIEFNKNNRPSLTQSRKQYTGYPTVGTIIGWAGNNSTDLTNNKYLLCDGQSLNKNTYSDLFNVIGYRYGGSGDNFNIPNFTNRYPAGSENTSNFSLDGTSGVTGGDYQMTNAHFPHTHSLNSVNRVYNSSNFATNAASNEKKRSIGHVSSIFSGDSTNPLQSDGNTAYNTQKATLPPYTIIGFIIKVLL
jgi:microcystin-dependent protein